MTETEMYKLLKTIKKTNQQPYISYEELKNIYNQCPSIEQLQDFCAYTNYLESPSPAYNSYRLTPLGEIFLSSYKRNSLHFWIASIAMIAAIASVIFCIIDFF